MTDLENPTEKPNCDCSTDPSCCAPSSTGIGRAWKTGIFTVVVLLAIGVSAYSLLWRDPGTDTLGCGSGAGGCGTECAVLTGIPALDQQLIGVGFGLVVISGETGSPETSAAIGGVAARLMAAGLQFRVINLAENNPGTRAVVDKYALTALPAVVALGGKNSMVFVGSEITAEALWQASQKVGVDMSACNPAQSPGTREPK